MLEVQPDGLSVSCPHLPRIGQVKNVLRQLNARKATGADNIPAWVFKRFAEELAVVTHDIITASIVQNKYPTMYKHALVSPVPKVHPPANLHDRVPVCKYADDCTFYESISTNDEFSMQVLLNGMHEWTTSNHMQINSKKTKDMFIDL